MPLPKRRHSNQRTRKRRTHYKLTPPTLARCKNCSAASGPVFRLDHHACPECGYYNGKPAVVVKQAQEAAE